LAQMMTKIELLQAEHEVWKKNDEGTKNDEAKIHMTSVFRVFR